MSQEQIDRENDRAVRRIVRARFGPHGFSAFVREQIEIAYSRGYSAGHEHQMQMRIRDEMDRRFA